MTGKLINSGKHNVKFIADKEGGIVGAIKGATQYNRWEILKHPHLNGLLHEIEKNGRDETNK